MSVAVNGESGPISTVLLFAVDDDFTFYFATHKNSFKAKGLNKDNRISMSIWEFNKMLVQCDGEAFEITDHDEAGEAFDKLTNSLDNLAEFWPPVLQIEGEGYIIYKVKTNWVRTLDLTDKKIISKSLFNEIVSK